MPSAENDLGAFSSQTAVPELSPRDVQTLAIPSQGIESCHVELNGEGVEPRELFVNTALPEAENWPYSQKELRLIVDAEPHSDGMLLGNLDRRTLVRTAPRRVRAIAQRDKTGQVSILCSQSIENPRAESRMNLLDPSREKIIRRRCMIRIAADHRRDTGDQKGGLLKAAIQEKTQVSPLTRIDILFIWPKMLSAITNLRLRRWD